MRALTILILTLGVNLLVWPALLVEPKNPAEHHLSRLSETSSQDIRYP